MTDHAENHGNEAATAAEESRAAQAAESPVNLTALVTDVVKFLVDHPEEVFVEEVKEGSHNVVLELSVAESDVGKVIGKQGRTVRSLRNLLDAAAGKANTRATLEIMEDDPEDGPEDGDDDSAASADGGRGDRAE